MRTANFLFTFRKKLHMERVRAAVGRADCAEGQQAGSYVTLIVSDAARESLSISKRECKRVAVPELERLRRLNVIVIVEENGWSVGSLGTSRAKGDLRSSGRIHRSS